MMFWLRLIYVAVVLSTVTILLLPVQLVALFFDLKLRRVLPRNWHRLACHLLGIKVCIHGTPETSKPLLLAANHASWKDILILGSVADVVFVAKREVRDWPVFGGLAKLQKTIFVAREQKRSTGNQVNEIAQRMSAGEIVVLFPEGTTSDGNGLLEIKSSLFGAASTAADHDVSELVYIQPVAIAYTGIRGMAMGRYHRSIAAWPGDIELLPHLLGVVKAGGIQVDVTFGEAEVFRKGDNRKVLSGKIGKKMHDMLHFSLRGGWRK